MCAEKDYVFQTLYVLETTKYRLKSTPSISFNKDKKILKYVVAMAYYVILSSCFPYSLHGLMASKIIDKLFVWKINKTENCHLFCKANVALFHGNN